MLAVLGWIVFGLVIGLIARAIMPGAQPMGFILTALLGIAGSFVGGWLGTFLSGAGGQPDLSPSRRLDWIDYRRADSAVRLWNDKPANLVSRNRISPRTEIPF